jgi:hypothetical protein
VWVCVCSSSEELLRGTKGLCVCSCAYNRRHVPSPCVCAAAEELLRGTKGLLLYEGFHGWWKSHPFILGSARPGVSGVSTAVCRVCRVCQKAVCVHCPTTGGSTTEVHLMCSWLQGYIHHPNAVQRTACGQEQRKGLDPTASPSSSAPGGSTLRSNHQGEYSSTMPAPVLYSSNALGLAWGVACASFLAAGRVSLFASSFGSEGVWQ